MNPLLLFSIKSLIITSIFLESIVLNTLVIFIIIALLLVSIVYYIWKTGKKNSRIEELEQSIEKLENDHISAEKSKRMLTQTIQQLNQTNSKLKKTNLVLEEDKQKLDILLLQKEKELLKSNMSPYFLQNSVSVLNHFAQKTLLSIQNFIPVMNHIVNESNEDCVLLENEIEFINRFLALQRLQLDPEFNLELNINLKEEHRDFKIVPMLLISFIEKAFKYTDLNNRDNYIIVNLEFDNESNLVYEVKNSAHFINDKPEHSEVNSQLNEVAINIRKRLAFIYNEDAELICERREDEFVTKLILPNYICN